MNSIKELYYNPQGTELDDYITQNHVQQDHLTNKRIFM